MPFLYRLTHVLNRACRNRRAYIWLIRSVQFGLFVLSGITAFLLRFEFSVPLEMKKALWAGVAAGVVCKVPIFHVFGLGRGMWRYFATPDLLRLACANAVASAIASSAILLAYPYPFPRSVLVIDFLLSLLFLTAVRAGTRVLLEAGDRSTVNEPERAFIYGGGAAGASLLHESRTNTSFGRLICGFIDDNPNKRGMLINGMPVRGCGSELPELVAAHRVKEVLIAIPSACGSEMESIIQHCHDAGVAFRTVPSLSELVQGRGVAAQIRDVAVEDVLGRSTVELDREGIGRKLQGRVALVTGAAGSIGSELCRQIARFEPSALIALDASEGGLFHLQQEIRGKFPRLRFHPEIGNIQNGQRLRDILRLHSPVVLYHAAAYKHVPMMEDHVFEAIENNVIGTYNVATAAAEFGVEDFVMISSDKAVRPANMMGATKRVAELVIRSLQNGGPRYVSVRFGNVLGSSGSVVPIFKKQIAAGGPVTVTHPDMRRFFMTIPEAAQLVLQASTMGRGGEIFVLDMGKPVRIVDLARQLIRLSGLKPDEDIRIVFTGTRPGEKLYEELSLADEETVPTDHEKIKVFAGTSLPFDCAMRHLAVLRGACERRDLKSLVFEMKSIVPDYTLSKELLERLLEPGMARLAGAVQADRQVIGRAAGLLTVTES